MITPPSKPKVIDKKENQACFVIDNLYPGYGITIGNGLRRVLLSSLEGAAVTQVKIKGVQHEFSTISGVLEDVIMIMLNLKELCFKVHSDEPQKGTLKVKGQKKVTAKDFKLPPDLELVNQDAPVATLTNSKTELEIEILVENGLGYETIEQRSKEKLAPGVIALDAVFTPIKRVSLKVENMRVGERTDFNRLFLDIETDGTITPEQALAKSSKILADHFSLFGDAFDEKEKTKAPEETKPEDISKTKIEDLKISTRTINSLLKNNIKTVGVLAKKSEEKLTAMEGMGESAVSEIKKALKKLGIELK